MLGLVLMFLIWIKDNIPGTTDVQWFAQGGGLIGKGHPPARRFNAGQKVIFWSWCSAARRCRCPASTCCSRLCRRRARTCSSGTSVHGIVSVLMIAVMLAHIYIGSIGMEGAFDAMGTGEVDLNWATRASLALGRGRAAQGRRPQGPGAAAGRIIAPRGCRRLDRRSQCEPREPGACARFSFARTCFDAGDWSGGLERCRQDDAADPADPRDRPARPVGLDAQARPSRLRSRHARQGFLRPSRGRRARGADLLRAALGADA